MCIRDSISSFLLMPGGGICYDYGVYYLTALVSILGSVRRACGIVRNPYPLRTNCNPSSPDSVSYTHLGMFLPSRQWAIP